MPVSLKRDKSHQLILLLVYIFVLVLGVFIISRPPVVDPDSAWGFLAMRSIEQGRAFNTLVSPDPANISSNQSAFLSWWSPGQYLVPWVFKYLLNVSIGRAVSLTVIISCLLGLPGYYRLFKRLGFTKVIAALSVAFIATQQFFMVFFSYYTGGELLLFAFLGWFLYGCFGFSKISLRTCLYIFLLSFVGFFCKSSVLWILVAGVCCMWVNISGEENKAIVAGGERVKLNTWIKNGFLLGIPLIAAFVIISHFYLSKGANPSSVYGGFAFIPEALLFPLASPLLSGFSVDEWFQGLIYQPDGQTLTYHQALVVLAGLAVLSCGLLWLVFRLIPDRKYRIALTTFYCFAIVIFSAMYLRQSAISFEGRHFRVVGLLATPGIVSLFWSRRLLRVVFCLGWLAFIVAGLNYFGGEVQQNAGLVYGKSGLSQQIYDNATINEITKLDKVHPGDAVFVVMSPDIALEISNNRSIIVDMENFPTGDFHRMQYRGKSGQLYILLPADFISVNKQPSILKSFSAYHHFSARQLSSAYWLYSAAN